MAKTSYADYIVEGAAAAGVAGSASENPILMGGNDAGGLRRPLLTDSTGTLQVGIAAGATDRTATGNITNTQTVSINTQGSSIARCIITGTWTGTIVFKVLAPDGTTALAESVYPYAPGGASVSSVTANGQWDLIVAGHQQFQVIGATVASGTAVVSIEATDAPGIVGVRQGTAANLNAQTVGNVASAAADSGNPIKVGGPFNTTQPTVTNGQRVDAQMTSRGAQIVATGYCSGSDDLRCQGDNSVRGGHHERSELYHPQE